MNTHKDYCVAIRTLGTAGDKYQMLLDSISRQSLKPQKVLVYIPYGYSLPQERLGWETFVRCDKGMVAQRSLPFNEVTSEFCLFCDDDISFPENFVESLLDELLSNDGDCISPDIYGNHFLPLYKKIIASLMWATPRKSDEWAFKINKYTSGYTYNNNPSQKTLKSQSAAFACFLCKMSVFRDVHFEDERWVDSIPYSLGDDQLFYYKLYLMGRKLFVCYNTGIKHLDAKSSRHKNESEIFRQSVLARFCLWYRSCYKIKYNKREKALCILLFGIKMSIIFIYHLVWSVCKMRFYRIINFISGLYKGFVFVHTKEYLQYPSFEYRFKI